MFSIFKKKIINSEEIVRRNEFEEYKARVRALEARVDGIKKSGPITPHGTAR